MGGVFWKGGSREGTRHMATTQFKMEDAYSLYNVIEFFCWKKVTMKERGGPFGPFKLQMALAQLCKITFAYLCKHPNTSIAKGKIWLARCWLW